MDLEVQKVYSQPWGESGRAEQLPSWWQEEEARERKKRRGREHWAKWFSSSPLCSRLPASVVLPTLRMGLPQSFLTHPETGFTNLLGTSQSH